MTSLDDYKDMTVLVTDDNETMRRLMRATLEESGFQVMECSSGHETISCFEEHLPDAILLDVAMPGMDGFETCRKLRRLPGGEHVPILIVTGLGDDDSIREAFDAGATDFFTKPINWAILSHRVRYMLRASDALQKIKEKQDQIHHLAFFDHLTGLANRSLFKASLEKALLENENAEKILAVLFLDLDRFKKINDTLGHHIGDLLLKKIADRINCCIRETDAMARTNQDESISYVSRLGGDEFTILLTDLTNPRNAGKVARRVIETIRQPMELEGHDVFVTASVGISLSPSDGKKSETLMKNADTAMYYAKERGRNRLQFYKKSLNSTTTERLALENDLRCALREKNFIIHYQPQTETDSGRIVGAEALIRWQHQEKGLILPGEFIPLAEDLGLMPEINNWVIRDVCRQLLDWQKQGLAPVTVSINLSSCRFNQQRTPEMFREILQEYPIDPQYLEVELTESALIENNDIAKAILQKLKNLGLGISIDDFGTGYSSLAYLKSFPIDALKIDRSFIQDISSDPNDTAIIRAIVAMAHSLELRVVAAGVETEEQFGFLQRIGCEIVQGYLFSNPLQADDFAKLLPEHSETQQA